MIGSALECYTRLLAEMHWTKGNRRTESTRLQLQDVLSYLRDKAAEEQGLAAQFVQDSCESRASELAHR